MYNIVPPFNGKIIFATISKHRKFSATFTIPTMQTCKETSRTLREIEAHYSDLSAKWDISADKQELIKDIEERILTQEHVYVDSALCLGLGTMRTTCTHSSDFDFGGKEKEDDDDNYWTRSTRKILRQLLVFETLLECLRESSL